MPGLTSRPISAATLAMLAGSAAAAPIPTASSPAFDPTRLVSVEASPLMQAVENLAAASENPQRARMNLLARIQMSPACYAPDLSPEEYERLLTETGMLPPGMAGDGLRYVTDTPVWLGNGSQGPSGTARPAQLTYSFPDDGITWGLASIFPTGPNGLNAMFTNIFGPGNVDRGRELVRQSFAGWRRSSGLTYTEVADDNTPMSSSTTRSASRGDVRIGGVALGNTGVLAYNPFPNMGSDMVINLSSQNQFANSFNNYRYFRNVVAHEHGHGTGYIHVVPCNNQFLMEPTIFLSIDMLSNDEKRAAGRNYGDRFAGNASASTAHDFGNLTSPELRSVIERDLSTNGNNGPVGSGADWFRFTLDSTQPVSISVVPTGGTYVQGQQSFGCSGSTASVNAQQAGNLNVELRDASGATVIQAADTAGPGQIETLNVTQLPAGTYTVRIYDAGPNPAENQRVQLYDLTIRVGTALAPPQAIAGVHKRCRANTPCFFMGNINSRPTETTATIPNSGYDWDLDGDGVFETNDNPQPIRTYVSNGVYDVTLRVTDSNGKSATDTIQVTVFGATTVVGGVLPSAGNRGTTVPVTITGTNLRNVTDASMVTVSGTGVTVIGTPTPNAMGTQVTGLSFVIAPGAELGPRSVTIANADGSGTGANLFVVEGTQCAADWDNSGTVNSADISAFLGAWLESLNNQNLVADFNQDSTVNSADISAFLSQWLADLSGC